MGRKITSISAYRNKKEKEEIQLQTALSVDMPQGLEQRLLQILIGKTLEIGVLVRGWALRQVY